MIFMTFLGDMRRNYVATGVTYKIKMKNKMLKNFKFILFQNL